MDILLCAFMACVGLVSYLVVIFTKHAGVGLNLMSWFGSVWMFAYAVLLFSKIEPDTAIVWTGEHAFSVPALIIATIGLAFLLCIDEKGKHLARTRL